MSDPAAWRTSKTAAAAAGKMTECSDLVKDGGEDGEAGKKSDYSGAAAARFNSMRVSTV